MPAAFCCLLPCSALGPSCWLDVTVAILAQGTDQALALLPASFQQFACCFLLFSSLQLGLPLAGARCHRSHFGSRYRSGLALLPASFRQIAAAFCCLLPCSALGLPVAGASFAAGHRLPLAGARCHRSHFGSRYRSGLGFAAGLLLAKCCFVFFLAAHWGYLLLELDVTVAILAQGTDQALALLPASFRQIAAASSCWS